MTCVADWRGSISRRSWSVSRHSGQVNIGKSKRSSDWLKDKSSDLKNVTGTVHLRCHLIYIYVKLNVYVCNVSLFIMHGHRFERICTKFGMWHPYTLWIVMGVSERRMSLLARAPLAVHMQMQISGDRGHLTSGGQYQLRREIQK